MSWFHLFIAESPLVMECCMDLSGIALIFLEGQSEMHWFRLEVRFATDFLHTVY
jgi:hypothetical protein